MKLVREYTQSTAIMTGGGLDAPFEESGAPLEAAPAGLSATQILVILRFYWKVTLLIAASVIALAAFGIKSMPKTYTATATLIIDSSLKKDPLAAVGVPENEMPSYIATQMELISSPIVLLPAVDRLKLTTDPQFLAGYGGNDEAGRREYVARNLASALQVDIGRGGQLLYITASAKYAGRAAELANGVTDVYLEEERRRANEPAAERARRYSEEVTELRAKVAAAQNNLAVFRQQRGITELGNNENADTETQALTTLEQRLLEAQNLRRSLEAKSAGQRLSADEALASPIIQQLKTQLSTQQTQLVQLTSTYGSQHPKVLEVKSQMALTERQLNEELHTISDNVTNDVARARDLETRYARAAAEQRTKVLHLRALQGEGEKLELELESAQSVYKRALDGFDQIAFASASNNANVSLLSRASPPFKASKPNKNKLFAGALAMALILSLAVPLGYELLVNRRLRCRDDIERALALPVLAEFNRVAVVSGKT